MIEPTEFRRSRSRVPSPRSGFCLTSAVAVLGLAMLSIWLGSASAQQAGPGVGPGLPGAPGMASTAEPAKEEPPTPAESFIDEAAVKVGKLTSCAADLEQKVDMLNEHVTLKGRYMKAPEYRIYFVLRVSGLPETSGSTFQVCDGETRWDYQSILEQQMYYKFSIKPVMERVNSPDLDPKMKSQLKEGMGFAGPETLLVGLRKLFRFEQEKEEGKLGDRAVWILRGTWRRDVRQGLTGPDQRQAGITGLLPPYIPMDATLYLGKDDGWPYKLVLLGRKPTRLLDTRKEGVDGRKIGSLSSIEVVNPTSITLEYTNVRLNPTLSPSEFAFTPPSNASVEDGTEMIVKQLDSAIAMQAERKKAEAAKKDGPILNQSLDVPLPPGQPSASPPPQQ
jgi:outer membrane lipoprotein-sorting protein